MCCRWCERVNNVAKAFNMREGFTRADDKLPARLMDEALKGGESKGHRISRAELDQMLAQYYTERGWDPDTGALLRPKLEELGLTYIADQLNL